MADQAPRNQFTQSQIDWLAALVRKYPWRYFTNFDRPGTGDSSFV